MFGPYAEPLPNSHPPLYAPTAGFVL